MAFHFSGDRLHGLRILSEGNTAFFDIWTGDIDLQKVYRLIPKSLNDINIIFCSLSTDIYDNFRIILLQKWNVTVYEHIDSRVLQTDGIDHASISLCNTRCRIPWPRYVCYSFGGYCT